MLRAARNISYENIRNNNSNFDFVGDTEVHISLTSIPSDPVTKANLARYILFYYSKFYEYATFDAKTPEGEHEQRPDQYNIYDHPSAFSPEDLPSDLCSTKVGLEIVRNHPTISEDQYRSLVTTELKNLVNTLGYNAPEISRKKFEAIDGRWVYYNNLRNNILTKTIGHTGPDYLHKRNFDTSPWIINTPKSGRATFAIGNPPECISSFLRAKNQLRTYFSQLSFYKNLGSGLEKRKNSPEEVDVAVSEIRRISTQGRGIYTTGHDSP